MKRVFIGVEKNPLQVTNCPINFTVAEIEWDLGAPIGNGKTLEEAIWNFKESWLLKYDEEITIELLTENS